LSIGSQKWIRLPNGSIAPVSSVPHGRLFETGAHVAIAFADLAMEFFDPAHHDAQPRAR
jgi:hypothetical protein